MRHSVWWGRGDEDSREGECVDVIVCGIGTGNILCVKTVIEMMNFRDEFIYTVNTIQYKSIGLGH